MVGRQASRPDNGFIAWQMILGHLGRHGFPDTRLVLQIKPKGTGLQYSSRLNLGYSVEEAYSLDSLADSLQKLWFAFEHYHPKLVDFVVNRPADYDVSRIFPVKTQDVLERLTAIANVAFRNDWHIMLIYHSVDVPEIRVKMRLIAHENEVQVSGQGSNVFEAARDLFHNASGAFVQFTKRAST